MLKIIIPVLLVGTGGAAGAVFRYTITILTKNLWNGFPAGTIIANVAGCLLMGVLMGFFQWTSTASVEQRLFFVTGFCGAFTTMSAFIYETDKLFRSGANIQGAVYMLLTLCGSYLLFISGFSLVKLWVK